MAPKKQHAQTLYQAFWSMSRHSMIAAAATPFLSAMAKQAVGKLLHPLGAGGTLEAVAPWADLVKRKGTAPTDKDTKEFLSDARNIGKNPNASEYINGEWHYADMPLGCDAYDPAKFPKFVRDDDVVHILCTAIEALQKKKSDRFSQINALRLVVHLVGDVHQPLHVGCSFLTKADPVKIVSDPKIIGADEKKFSSDRGGNALLLPVGSAGVALHAYWDSTLGGSNPLAMAAESVNASAEDIQKLIKSVEKLQGKNAQSLTALSASNFQTEVYGWATGSLLAARKAYQSLKIDANKPHKKNSFFVKWEGKTAYDKRCGPLVKNRMTAAANNLANLLNAIF